MVCVVGDGAMTAGMTLEGLHHAGGLGKDFLVILNDNQMSISKNVGAISSYLNRTFTGEFYTQDAGRNRAAAAEDSPYRL